MEVQILLRALLCTVLIVGVAPLPAQLILGSVIPKSCTSSNEAELELRDSLNFWYISFVRIANTGFNDYYPRNVLKNI